MDLLNYFRERRGRQAELARQIDAYPTDLSKWANKERPVPIWRCIPIETATEGAVTRQELRPDDWHRIWPDLATPAGEPSHA